MSLAIQATYCASSLQTSQYLAAGDRRIVTKDSNSIHLPLPIFIVKIPRMFSSLETNFSAIPANLTAHPSRFPAPVAPDVVKCGSLEAEYPPIADDCWEVWAKLPKGPGVDTWWTNPTSRASADHRLPLVLGDGKVEYVKLNAVCNDFVKPRQMSHPSLCVLESGV